MVFILHEFANSLNSILKKMGIFFIVLYRNEILGDFGRGGEFYGILERLLPPCCKNHHSYFFFHYADLDISISKSFQSKSFATFSFRC